MRVEIKHVCGHVEEHYISGKIDGREQRIERLENRQCEKCYYENRAKENLQSENLDIIEIHYSEYKKGNYNAVPNSYDRKTKTIKVYVEGKAEIEGINKYEVSTNLFTILAILKNEKVNFEIKKNTEVNKTWFEIKENTVTIYAENEEEAQEILKEEFTSVEFIENWIAERDSRNGVKTDVENEIRTIYNGILEG